MNLKNIKNACDRVCECECERELSVLCVCVLVRVGWLMLRVNELLACSLRPDTHSLTSAAGSGLGIFLRAIPRQISSLTFSVATVGWPWQGAATSGVLTAAAAAAVTGAKRTAAAAAATTSSSSSGSRGILRGAAAADNRRRTRHALTHSHADTPNRPKRRADTLTHPHTH